MATQFTHVTSTALGASAQGIDSTPRYKESVAEIGSAYKAFVEQIDSLLKEPQAKQQNTQSAYYLPNLDKQPGDEAYTAASWVKHYMAHFPLTYSSWNFMPRDAFVSRMRNTMMKPDEGRMREGVFEHFESFLNACEQSMPEQKERLADLREAFTEMKTLVEQHIADLQQGNIASVGASESVTKH